MTDVRQAKIQHGGRRLPILDGLRGLALLLVFLTHGWRSGWLPQTFIGRIGVLLFFTLSGFLMATLYMPGKLSRNYWVEFLIRRSWKIYPAFFVMTIIEWKVGLLFPIKPRLEDLQQLIFFDSCCHYWTIPVEVFCYALLPFYAILLLLLPGKPIHKLMFSMAVWVILILCADFARWNNSPAWPYASLFLGGVNAGYAYNHFHHSLSRYQKAWTYIAIACLLALAACIAVSYAYPVKFRRFTVHSDLVPPFLALLLFSTALSQSRLFYPLTNRCMVYLGTISYSFYLVHDLIFDLTKYYQRYFDLGATAAFSSAMCISFMVTLVLFYAVEQPMVRQGARLARKFKGT